MNLVKNVTLAIDPNRIQVYLLSDKFDLLKTDHPLIVQALLYIV